MCVHDSTNFHWQSMPARGCTVCPGVHLSVHPPEVKHSVNVFQFYVFWVVFAAWKPSPAQSPCVKIILEVKL